MEQIPVTDNHIHVDPVNGEGPVAVATKFKRAGGSVMISPNKPTWTVGASCSFREAIGVIKDARARTELKRQADCIIIAGPNGAGKTTFALEYLPREASCPIYVNADLIAAGLSPFIPTLADIRAGQIMLQEIDLHVSKRDSFAFETTLSGRVYARMIPVWREKGFRVKLIYLCISDVRVALERIRTRVRQGGHDIPDDVVRRRYESGWRNFNTVYKPLVNSWILYDNSGNMPALLDEGVNQ